MAVYLLPDKVVSIALSQVGQKESPLGSNKTKYAKELDAIHFYNGNKNGVAWCDVFVDWCVWQAAGRDKARALKALYEPTKDNCGAGCKFSAQYFRSHNAWSKTAKVGAQIFFGKLGAETHTGVVVAVGVNTVTTVEGNVSNMVKKRSYNKNDPKIVGYGLIKYDNQPQPQPDPPSPQPEPPKPEPTPTPTPKGKKYKCTCSKGVNIRAGAGATYKKVGAVNYGQIVTIYSTKNGWGNMTTSGNRWVCMKYFKAV